MWTRPRASPKLEPAAGSPAADPSGASARKGRTNVMNIPGFPGGLDFAEMMKQAQEMQEKMQREMDQIRVDATVGGGMVTVLMSGTKDLLEVKIDAEMLKNADVEMLQDMIVAAVNEAGRKVDEKLKGQLGAMMPPGMGL